MSTSDAGELLRLIRAAPPACRTLRGARTATARPQQDETFDERLQPDVHNCDETPTGQDPHRSAIRPEGPHRGLKLGADRRRAQEAAPRTGSEAPTQRPRFTTSLLIKLSKTLSFDKPEAKLKPKPDSCPRSFTEPQKRVTKDGCWQVNRQPPDAPAETASDCPLPRTKPFLCTKEEEVTSNGCNELETTRHLSVNHSLSNGDFGPHEYNGLHILPCRAQPKSTGSGLVEEEIKDHTKFENQRNLELSNPAATMLSSTMVTVLAPHWSGRLRRTKRFEGTGNSESQGSLQDVSSTAANHAHEDNQNQHGAMRVLRDGSQPQVRAPFLGTRRKTEDWTTRSDPSRLGFESKRKIIQTVSLDVTSGRMDNRILDTGALSPVATNAPLLSPLPHDPDEQKRNPKTMHQGALSTSSSKPTTSSMLLSLRRINSSGRSSNAASTFSDENPAPSDQEGNLLTAHLSQTFLNNNERSKSVLSPSSISYRTTETRPIVSPSSCNYREMNTSESHFFSTSTINKDRRDTPFTQQPPTCSKQAFLSGVPSASQQSCRDSNKNTNQFPKSLIPSPRHSPYDHSAHLKTHPLPRRTTLTSTSWWKQVTQEGISPLPPSDTTNIKDRMNTPLVPPCNDSSALPGPTDSKRFSSQIPNNKDQNPTTESVCKGNMESQGGTHNLKQRNAKDPPEHKSDSLFKQQYGSCSNNREPQKPLNLPDILSRSKISNTTAQTTLSHSKDLSKGAASNSSFIANVTTLPPTFPNLKSSDTPTESSSKYKTDHCSSKTNSTLTSTHSKDSEKFTQRSLSHAVSLESQAPTSKTTSGLPLTPNAKTGSSFHFHPDSSQTNVHTSSTTGSSLQTSKFTNTANATLLGFERSYASIPKHFHPKTVSCLTSTVGAFSKTNYSPVSTASVPSSSIGSHPVATAAPSPSLLTPPAALTITSSPTAINLSSLLTPPATPIITSPSYLETPSPKEGRTFSSSPERDQKKPSRVEGKRVRRVTWEDSVDLQCSEPITDEKPEPSGTPTSPLSPSRSPRSVRSPSIFSFLRSGSPTTSTSPLCSPISDQDSPDFTTTGQERTPSMESAPPPFDFSSGYKLRYSSPPYSTLKSSRSTQGEPKTTTPRSPLFQQAAQSVYTPLSLNAAPSSAITIPTSKPPLSLPFQNKVATQESIKCEGSDTYQLNNHSNKRNQDPQNGQILLIDNRVDISSQCLQGVKAHNPSSACVTETLVYSIKSKANTVKTAPKNTTPKPLQHTANTGSVETKLSQQPHRLQSKKASGEPHSHSDHSSSGGSSADGQSQCEGSCNRGSKESVLGKSRFFSVESNNEQSPKRNRFALKKSVSTPNSSLARSDSERSNKTNNKMDQVINKLRQTFSTRRSDDDPSFPWKWKRASQTPSDISNVTADCTKRLDERVPEEEVVMKDVDQGTEDTKRRTQNIYTLIPLPAVGITRAGDKFSIWSEKSASETDQEEQNVCAGHKSESKTQVHITPRSPTTHQFDFYKDNRTDHKPTNQLSICRDPSPGRSPNLSDSYPTQLRKSTSTSRSPFSPFSSISPLSQYSSPDVTDDNVFYSPKPQRRREPSSPCEPGEGISLGGSRRSRASTGPPSAGPGQDNEHFASSYADLKYGIEPGRSFSVSSVLSTRPSGTGRISTGSRHMSVGDLSKSCSTCGGYGKDVDQWSFPPDGNAEYDCQHPSECCKSYLSADPGKMRSRSLPRSLTRRLANWSSDASVSQPGTTIDSKPAHLWSPNMNTFHFGWETEGPPTPPPTPPLSPVNRRMSTSPSTSSPPFSSSPGASHSPDTQSSRGHLPSRGYVSSLSTFDESTDSSSDTTTDDEYYLETGDGEEKETEL